jgi:hypothetical protein
MDRCSSSRFRVTSRAFSALRDSRVAELSWSHRQAAEGELTAI